MTADVTLTDAERERIRLSHSPSLPDMPALQRTVERIVADRLAAERERIAQAIEAEVGRGYWRIALARAARIARGDA